MDLAAIIVVGRRRAGWLDDSAVTSCSSPSPAPTVGCLIGPPWPVTVTTDADVREVADRLIDSRQLSVVVLDEDDRPLGRILADDVLDMLIRGHRRWQFPRAVTR